MIRYGLDDPGIEFPGGGDIFNTRLDWPWGPSGLLYYNGYRVLLEGVKLPGRDNHLPPSSAEVKERVVIFLLSFWAFVTSYRANFAFFFFTLPVKFTGFVLAFCFAARFVVDDLRAVFLREYV